MGLPVKGGGELLAKGSQGFKVKTPDGKVFNASYEQKAPDNTSVKSCLDHAKIKRAAIVEPNFSLFNETPVAFGLQAVYKKRWIVRAMQECGIPVFVDLNVANKILKVKK